jgi:DNA-binding transcriptional MerR regulator
MADIQKNIIDDGLLVSPKNQDERKYYTVNNIAEMLNVAPNTVRNWTEALDFFIQCERDKQGQRLYTEEHLDKFRYIYELKVVEGIPIKVIKKVLEEQFKRGYVWNNNLPAIERPKEIEDTSKKLEKLSTDIENISKVLKVMINVVNQNTELAQKQAEQLHAVSQTLEVTSKRLQQLESNNQANNEQYAKITQQLDEHRELLQHQNELVRSLRESLLKRQEEQNNKQKSNSNNSFTSKLKNLFRKGE